MAQFLTEEWFGDVESLRADQPEPPAALADVVINLTVVGGPEGDIQARMEGGRFERDHVENAPTTLTIPYDVARKLLIEGDQQAAMQAFMAGQIKVQGDMTKLMAMQQAGGPSPEQQAFQQKLRELTD